MAKTAGRTRKPLPPSVADDLRTIGFVYRERASYGLPQHIWQHKHYPSLEVWITASNTPGDQELLWQLPGGPVQRTTEEEMTRQLAALATTRQQVRRG